jgi:hypothetical protein
MFVFCFFVRRIGIIKTVVSAKEATMSDQVQAPAAGGGFNHIEIPGDILIPDEEFCLVVLAGACRRTATRYDAEGLPFVMVRGQKFRPLNAGRAWVAGRIQAVAYRPRRRRG